MTRTLDDLHGLARTMVLVGGICLVVAACGGDDLSGIDAPVDTTGTTSSDVAVDPPATSDAPEPDAAGADRSSELVGRWEVANYALPDGGGLTNVVGDAAVFIEFGTDGTLSYNTGCNGGSGAYSTSGVYQVPASALDDVVEGQPIAMGPAFTQTEIGCEGFLGDQDRDLPTNMGSATRFRLDGDRLLLADEFLLIEAVRTG